MTASAHVVLVVDDDADIRESLEDALADEGFGVALAANGLEALDYLRRHRRPCVILLDWMMPHCDGAAFCARQAKDPAIADIPVVVCSADARIDEKARGLAVADCLKKPFKLDALFAVISRHCAR